MREDPGLPLMVVQVGVPRTCADAERRRYALKKQRAPAVKLEP